MGDAELTARPQQAALSPSSEAGIRVLVIPRAFGIMRADFLT